MCTVYLKVIIAENNTLYFKTGDIGRRILQGITEENEELHMKGMTFIVTGMAYSLMHKPQGHR